MTEGMKCGLKWFGHEIRMNEEFLNSVYETKIVSGKGHQWSWLIEEISKWSFSGKVWNREIVSSRILFLFSFPNNIIILYSFMNFLLTAKWESPEWTTLFSWTWHCPSKQPPQRLQSPVRSMVSHKSQNLLHTSVWVFWQSLGSRKSSLILYVLFSCIIHSGTCLNKFYEKISSCIKQTTTKIRVKLLFWKYLTIIFYLHTLE